jgi:hypothetical protein
MGQWDSGDDWVRRSRKVVDDQLMRDIVGDARRGDIHARASVIPQPKASQQTETPTDRSGWQEQRPLRPPEGINYIDELCDQADAQDRAQRIRQLVETAALQRAEAELKARQLGLSHEEWARLSEKDLKDRKAQQAKKAEVKK